MTQYIDGFVLPIPKNRLDDYRRVAAAVAEIWKEYGALDYREYVGEGPSLEGTRSFAECMAASSEDVIVFGWVAFESRAARDRANEKVASDPRMAGLVNETTTGFDAGRMAYGGFRPLVG